MHCSNGIGKHLNAPRVLSDCIEEVLVHGLPWVGLLEDVVCNPVFECACDVVDTALRILCIFACFDPLASSSFRGVVRTGPCFVNRSQALSSAQHVGDREIGTMRSKNVQEFVHARPEFDVRSIEVCLVIFFLFFPPIGNRLKAVVTHQTDECKNGSLLGAQRGVQSLQGIHIDDRLGVVEESIADRRAIRLTRVGGGVVLAIFHVEKPPVHKCPCVSLCWPLLFEKVDVGIDNRWYL